MQLANVLEEHSASISRAAKRCSLGEFLDPAKSWEGLSQGTAVSPLMPTNTCKKQHHL
jgi:hypothetical protein